MLTLAKKIRPARLYRAGLYYEKESKKDKNMIRIDDHELVFFSLLYSQKYSYYDS